MPVLTPSRSMRLAAFGGIFFCLAAVWYLASRPWLGLQLVARNGAIEVLGVDAGGPAVPPGARVAGLLPAGGSVSPIQSDDLVELPDLLPDYAATAAFFQRQDALARLMAAPGTRIVWQSADGAAHSSPLPGRGRPVADLPGKFWLLLASALAGLLIGAWIVALRPGEAATRWFAAGGVMMFFGCLTDAVYGNRELALPGGVFAWLSGANHFFGVMYGATMMGLLVVYPRRLAGRPLQRAMLGVALAWWLLDVARVVPGPDLGVGLAIMVEVILASLLAVIQWRVSRRHPLERAALRWFLVAFLGTAWLFVSVIVFPMLLGQPILIEQGYADSMLVVLYMGIAVGVSRHRLFDLDVWAYRILLVVLGAALVAGLDLLLIWALHLGPLVSLGWALFVAGWVYFPIRQWLWQRMAGGAPTRMEGVLPDLIEIAFTASPQARERRWRALLDSAFEPLRQVEGEVPAARAAVADEGLALRLPACAGMAARELHFAAAGKRLFAPADAEFAQGLCELMERAAASRDAYERGAMEERGRVYRDLHDDIGAKLLSLAIGAENPARADLARSALNDLRDVVSHGGRGATPLSELLADWRAEMDHRLAAAGVRLAWRQPYDLPDPGVAAGPALHLGRILREAISNVLRHARAGQVWLDVGCDGESLEIGIRDDGCGLPEPPPRPGKGLLNMRSRAQQLGGRIDWQTGPAGGCAVRLTVPCRGLDGLGEAGPAPHSRGPIEAGAALP